MAYDKPIIIQKVSEVTETWEDLYTLHARVNKTSGSEYVNAGSVKSKSTLTFEVRYFKDLEAIDHDRGSYRIIYNGYPYNIQDYDDYLESHKTIKFVGVA